MAEESKFAGTLQRLRKPPESREGEKTAQSPILPQQPASRSSGKRSDPSWKNITILMRDSVKRDVRYQLSLEGQGRDISSLVDELLTEWLDKNRQKGLPV
jgi:hypothetical protein